MYQKRALQKKVKSFRPAFCRLAQSGLILVCAVASVSACADFSAAARNNSGVSNACVDRDLRDGDACVPAVKPADTAPVEEISYTP